MLTLWLLRLFRFCCWFGPLWVHFGLIYLLLGDRFGLWCRIYNLSSRVHILTSHTCGPSNLRYWFLMAHRPLNALRTTV